MTLPLNSRLSALYDTNGTQKDFSFGFRVFFDPDNGGYGLEVRRQTADGYEVIPKSDYLVLPVEDNSAGVVRFSVAPSAGQQIYIAGKTPTIQQLVLTNFGRYSAESIETQFDFITAIIQEWLSALSEEERQRIAGDDILRSELIAQWTADNNEFKDYIESLVNALIGADILPLTDRSIKTWSGRTQEDKNRDYLSILDFGAVEGEDVSTAFKAMVNYINANPNVQHIDIRGIYTTSEPLDFNITGGTPALKTASWAFEVTALAAMEYIVSFNSPFVEHSGYAKGYGYQTNPMDWKTYGCDHIFVMYTVSRSSIPKLHPVYSKLWGVRHIYNSSNSNIYAHYSQIVARYCGGTNTVTQAGDFNNLPALNATFTKIGNDTRSGSLSQVTTISVSDFPFDESYFNKTMLFVSIDGKSYRVREWNYAAKTLGIFPWLPDATTGGNISYFFGGAVRNEGANSAGAQYQSIDARNCASAFEDAGLYGSIVHYLSAQYCTVGNVSGFAAGGTIAQVINGAYTERVYRNMLVFNASIEVYGRTGAFAGLPYVNCERLAPRTTGNASEVTDAIRWSQVYMPYANTSNFSGVYSKGKVGGYSSNDATIELSPARLPHTYKRDSLTVNLINPLSLNSAGGFDDAFLTVIGPSVRFIPEGNIVFNPPAGWTVNGKASITFNRFSKVPNFKIFWDIQNTNCIVVYEDINNTLQSSRSTATKGATSGQSVTTITIDSSIGTASNSAMMEIKAIGNTGYVDILIGVGSASENNPVIRNNSTSGVVITQTGKSDNWQVVVTFPSAVSTLVCTVEVLAGGHSSAQFATNPTITFA